jgi:hypothetical protein
MSLMVGRYEYYVAGLLNLKKTTSFKPSGFTLGIPPNNISSFVRLEIPGCNEDDISFANPHPLLHSSPNSAESSLTIGTFHTNTVIAKKLYSNAQNFSLSWNSNANHFTLLARLTLEFTTTSA